MSDIAAFYDSIRASTIKLLGYDSANPLTAAQQIRVDRAITLRLVIDDLQARQMRAEVIDVKAFVAASEDLERMVGGNPETSTTGHDFSGAREELRNFLVKRANAIARRDDRLLRDVREREELAAVVAAAPSAPSPDNGVCPTAGQTPPPPDTVVPIDREFERLASRTVSPQPADERGKGVRAALAYGGSGVPGGVLNQPLPEWWGK